MNVITKWRFVRILLTTGSLFIGWILFPAILFRLLL